MNAITFSVNFLVILLTVFSTVARATFTCTQEGFFTDPDSTDCTGFIYCNQNLQPVSQQCSSDEVATYFWPDKKICYSNYICSTGLLLNNDNTNPCAGQGYQNVADKHGIDCSSYIKCGYQYFGNCIPFAKKMYCPSGTYYQPDIYRCTDEYVCTNYQCQNEGYVPDPASSDCSTFIDCQTRYVLGVTELIPFVVNCPPNTKFSPHLLKCDSYYTCGGSDPHQGFDPCNNYNWQNPLAANDIQNDCQTYFRCQQQLNYYKTYDVIVKESCPTNTLFSSLIGKCYYNHACNAGCSHDPCQSGDGRYVDFQTSDCKTFLECRNDGKTGEAYMPSIGKRYCPDGSLFNPAISHCDQSYVCQPPQSNFCYEAVATTTTPPTTTTSAS